MSRIPEEIIESQSKYMQLYGAEKESFAAGARWAEKFLDEILKAEIKATLKNLLQNAKSASTQVEKIISCKHARIEEIQGGQIERCLDCGKTWG